MKRIFCFLFILFSFGFISYGQGDSSPVKWRFNVKMLSPTEGKVTVTAILEAPWHIYGTTKVKDGPVPTSFDFSGSTGVEFLSDLTPTIPAEEKLDPSFNQKLYMWSGKVSFIRNFKLTGDAKDAIIQGAIKYMCCDDNNCMPPKTQNFNLKVKPYVVNK